MRCILFFGVSLFDVSAAKSYEFIGFGEMHPILCCILSWLECNQTIGLLDLHAETEREGKVLKVLIDLLTCCPGALGSP